MQGIVSLVVSYATLTFSETLNYFNFKKRGGFDPAVGFQASEIIKTDDFLERSSNLIDNSKMIDLIIDYCDNNLGYSEEMT
jgi:hypothetical protein